MIPTWLALIGVGAVAFLTGLAVRAMTAFGGALDELASALERRRDELLARRRIDEERDHG